MMNSKFELTNINGHIDKLEWRLIGDPDEIKRIEAILSAANNSTSYLSQSVIDAFTKILDKDDDNDAP